MVDTIGAAEVGVVELVHVFGSKPALAIPRAAPHVQGEDGADDDNEDDDDDGGEGRPREAADICIGGRRRGLYGGSREDGSDAQERVCWYSGHDGGSKPVPGC